MTRAITAPVFTARQSKIRNEFGFEPVSHALGINFDSPEVLDAFAAEQDRVDAGASIFADMIHEETYAEAAKELKN